MRSNFSTLGFVSSVLTYISLYHGVKRKTSRMGVIWASIVTLIAAALTLYKYFERPKNFPAGPLRFPIVGSLPLVSLPVEQGFQALSKKYGPIFSLYIGNYPAVVLSDSNLVREALKNDKFAGRPSLRPMLERSGGVARGIGPTSAEEWKEQRRFTLKILRGFGFGKTSMEELICCEAQDLVNSMKKEIGKSVSLDRSFNIAALNSLWYILAGERFAHDDLKLSEILRLLLGVVETNGIQGAFYFMPWLTKLFPHISGYKKSMDSIGPTIEFLKEKVEAHKDTLTINEPRDFIDAYIQEIRMTNDKDSSFYKEIGEESLIMTLMDLVIAGVDTTSATITWAILYAILYPDEQVKVHKELDSLLQPDKMPSLELLSRMPRMKAFITETLRMSSIVPFSIFHSITETVEFNGYTIPKDTIIIPSLWQVHHDEYYWKDPEVFRPDRFIDEDGHFKKDDDVMAFSTGKRICPGETLARNQLFIFLASIFQTFKFQVDPDNPPVLKRNKGMVAKPDPFCVLLNLRDG